MSPDVPVVLGVDIGGSKTHGICSRGGETLAETLRGAANPSSVGPAAAAAELDRVVDDLLAGVPDGRVDAVSVGASGADSDDARARIHDVLARRLPGVPVRVVHDTGLVLAAAGLDEGVVVISGTGSSTWGSTADGRTARAGGWGYLLGDEGSAYGVTRAAVQHVLHRADDGLAPDALGRALLEAVGIDRGVDGPHALLDAFYARPGRRAWAAHAAVVFGLADAGEPAALTVVEGCASELVRAATRVGRRLDLHAPVVLAGGLARHQPLLQATVTRGLEARGFSGIRVLDRDPVHGAVRLAEAGPVAAGR